VSEPSVALVVVTSIAGGLVMFAGIFAGTLWLIAAVGWARLARTHAASGPTPAGQSFAPRLVFVGPVRYRGGAVRFVCGPGALVLEAHPIFRLMHRPIALSYAVLSVEPAEQGFVRVRIAGSDVALRLQAGAWREIELARTAGQPAP